MSVEAIGLLGVLILLLLIALKTPISLAMMLVGIVGFSVIVTPGAALSMVSSELFSNFSSYSLSVIPLFIWMGYTAYYSGVGTRLYNFAYKMVGHKPGGLAIATQAACGLFGAICGSNTATAATMGAIALPEMRRYGYNDSLSTASVAAGGALGILIPPSVIFIVYGIATEQSIGKLFIAGIIPGILLMLLYMMTIYLMVKFKPELGPAGPKSSWKERWKALGDGIFEIIIIFSISLGGLFAGWFTPTEAGAVGAASILTVTVLTKRLTWDGFKKSLTETTRTTAMIMLMVAGAMIFGRFLAVSRLPAGIATWAAGLELPSIAVLGIILLIYMLLGSFIDALALILLTVPIFYPVVVNILHYDPIWFGVIIVLVVAMGVITPPVGMNVFVIKGVVPDIPVETIFKGVWPFVGALLLCIVILILFPQLVLVLPELFM